MLTGRTATYAYRQTGTGRSKPAAVVSQVIGSVSLKSSKPQVLYGQTVTLSGTATFAPVSLQQRVRGQRGWKQLQLLTPDAAGAYSTTYKPVLSAKYRATIAGGQLVSGLSTVLVKPTLTIKSQAKKTKANHTVTITSRITPGSAATRITLLQCNTSRGSWERVAAKRPTAAGGVSFAWAAEAGKNYLKTTVVRVNSAPGFVAPTSGTITITAIAPKAKPVAHKHKKPAKPTKPPKSC